MRIESLKLLSGVLALRRFTIDELVAFTEVHRATAASWLSRHPAFFIRTPSIPTGARGRPALVHELRPGATRRLRAIVRAVPDDVLEGAYHAGGQPDPVRLQALPRVRAYAEMLGTAIRDGDRDEARAQLGDWVAAARRQADGFQRARVRVMPDDLEHLAEYETLVEERPEGRTSRDPATILERAGHLVDVFEVGASMQRSRAWHASSTDVGDPLIVLAALALSDKLSVSTHARRSIREAAEFIDAGTYRHGLATILDDARRNRSYENVAMVVIDGMRRHTTLLRERGLAEHLRQRVAASDLGRVNDAYVMACYDMPVVEPVRLCDLVVASGEGGALRGMATVGPQGPLGRISAAIEAIASEVSAFVIRAVPTHREPTIEVDGAPALRGTFEDIFLASPTEGRR